MLTLTLVNILTNAVAWLILSDGIKKSHMHNILSIQSEDYIFIFLEDFYQITRNEFRQSNVHGENGQKFLKYIFLIRVIILAQFA